ncbi:DUF2786 domain-containing protein [Micromonospora sp. WMMD736]|uniref:DUF2786 domain-containing protein n=1 Tax=Micromonospora sp. WMMD736 TaxID=3404112 RepID=UPI003B938DE9
MSNDSTSPDMLSKVRKLLAQAEDPACTPAESKAFTAKAAELIARYGIEKALLNAAMPEAQREAVADRQILVPAPYSTEKSALLHLVAQPLNVHTVRLRTTPRRVGYTVHLFGFPSDLERVELLFTSLLVQASHGIITARPIFQGESPTSYRRAWLRGFGHEVWARLTAAEQRAKGEHEGPSTDLVLANRKSAVDSRAAEVYPKLRTLPKAKISSTGYGAGRLAGQRADLGGDRVSTAAGAAIGT